MKTEAIRTWVRRLGPQVGQYYRRLIFSVAVGSPFGYPKFEKHPRGGQVGAEAAPSPY